MKPKLLILGTRGLPAAHGGFETFAERAALFMVERGWDVGVYCQDEVETVRQRVTTEMWRGIELIRVAVTSQGPWATLEFDYHCAADASRRQGVCLVLGYNGALFLPLLRWRRRPVITNMDGIEWRRPKWSLPVKGWFWINEWIAAWSSHRLVADHPAIADHLATRRPRNAIVTIPYGGDPVTDAPVAPLAALGVTPGHYMVSIARIEPDNNILTLVEAFSRRRRDAKLVVLGKVDVAIPYHAAVLSAAGEDVVFPGAIYDQDTVKALRFHARAYLHGHTVGGTNPSLVEALAAGCAVIAHDNRYNRGTAGEDQHFFADTDSCAAAITTLLADDAAVARSRAGARRRSTEFDWIRILESYEAEFNALAAVSRSPTPLTAASAAA